MHSARWISFHRPGFVGPPQPRRGGVGKPRATPWGRKLITRSAALKGRHRGSWELGFRPFRASHSFDRPSPGRCPGLSLFAPSGLVTGGKAGTSGAVGAPGTDPSRIQTDDEPTENGSSGNSWELQARKAEVPVPLLCSAVVQRANREEAPVLSPQSPAARRFPETPQNKKMGLGSRKGSEARGFRFDSGCDALELRVGDGLPAASGRQRVLQEPVDGLAIEPHAAVS